LPVVAAGAAEGVGFAPAVGAAGLVAAGAAEGVGFAPAVGAAGLVAAGAAGLVAAGAGVFTCDDGAPYLPN